MKKAKVINNTPTTGGGFRVVVLDNGERYMIPIVTTENEIEDYVNNKVKKNK